MAIVAVALMSAFRAVGGLTDAAASLRDRTYAQWSAENRLSQIRVQREFPAQGRRTFDCSQGNRALLCQEDIFATPNAGFRRVEIQVFEMVSGKAGHRLARLVGFATNLS